MTYKARVCRSCSLVFQPNTSREAWCSNDCRFKFHINPKWDVNECWEWDGAIFKKTGYGQFGSGKSGVYTAHKYSYQLFKGQVPEGLFVCHSCDNRKCFNPNHLWVGTHADNMNDMIQKGRSTLGNKYPQCSGDNHWRKRKEQK